MAYYEGETLKERIERGPLALDDAIDIARQVGQGLSKAHAAGIVHRDIKPANLLIATSGVVKILDLRVGSTPTSGTIHFNKRRSQSRFASCCGESGGSLRPPPDGPSRLSS